MKEYKLLKYHLLTETEGKLALLRLDCEALQVSHRNTNSASESGGLSCLSCPFRNALSLYKF